MDDTEASEHDMYIAQLKEVFDSCDQTGSGQLNRQELFFLCDKLQLEDQSEYLVNGLLKDKEEVNKLKGTLEREQDRRISICQKHFETVYTWLIFCHFLQGRQVM